MPSSGYFIAIVLKETVNKIYKCMKNRQNIWNFLVHFFLKKRTKNDFLCFYYDFKNSLYTFSLNTYLFANISGMFKKLFLGQTGKLIWVWLSLTTGIREDSNSEKSKYSDCDSCNFPVCKHHVLNAFLLISLSQHPK